ncbi:MAG: DnaD domain protein [Lachnospiraceae bacterium]|nr:DnaD domain protein [Lachnospiraceae bacterium]MCD8250330.1 DnaD domain protein [Lachnospiraceae bacterium]
MGQFVLKSAGDDEQTSVSNLFLDYYMPKANGEYVKVYLYLLRALKRPSLELSVSGLADALDRTESDILRALKYWEKQGVLRLECDSTNTLQGIYLCTLSAPDDTVQTTPAKESVQEESPVHKSYSAGEIEAFANNEECRQLLFVCSQYMGKTLSPSEIETLLYFYDQLHFSTDLLEYLVEYCVCKGSKSIHYIRRVGLSWAEAHITTVSEAKERTNVYHKNTFSVMKAFGLNDRNPVDSEQAYIEKWLNTWGFPLELVLEACSRTMEQLHKASFRYADRILQDWHEKKVHTLADVQVLDRDHRKAAPKKKARTRQTGFTNFQQRDYDFDELEKQLLRSQT